jgi:outer membrane protein OmpA-like peptidoglycan-associated protein
MVLLLAGGFSLPACTSGGEASRLRSRTDSLRAALRRERELNDRLQRYVEDIYYREVEPYQPSGSARPSSLLAPREEGRADFAKSSASPADSAGGQPLAEAEAGISMPRQAPIVFDSGSVELTKEHELILTEIADRLKQDETLLVIVEGHTDNRERSPLRSVSDSWDLSALRASRVLRALINRGISPERLVASGRGMFRPISSNLSPEGRSRNRRVEIRISRPSLP